MDFKNVNKKRNPKIAPIHPVTQKRTQVDSKKWFSLYKHSKIKLTINTPKKEKIFVDAQSPLIQKIENDQNNHSNSNLVKYLDLNKFKVEKCKNLSNGKQHNHKHCRYYHTLKDKRRILNYDCVNL